MGKYIVLAIVVVLLYALVRAKLRGRAARRGRPPGERLAEDMVRCAQCGVHLPRAESLLVRGESFCSPEHERLYDGRGGRGEG